MPAATAARASSGMNSGWPPLTPLAAEGCCTEWVASKTTGARPAQDGERAEIDYEVVVAKGRSALREEDALIARGADLLDAVAHVPGRDKLAFLDVDGAACAAGGDQQVGLAAEEGRNLKDIDSFGGNFAVGGLVDIGENRQAGIFGDAAEDSRSLYEAGAAKTPHTGAIGLVVAGFEDEGNLQVGGDALDGFSDGACVGLGLNDAGTGD